MWQEEAQCEERLRQKDGKRHKEGKLCIPMRQMESDTVSEECGNSTERGTSVNGGNARGIGVD